MRLTGGRIDDQKLFRLLVERGLSQREAATHLGVSEAAISKRVKLLGLTRPRRSAAVAHIDAATDQGLDLVGQLRKLNEQINAELEWALGEARTPGGNRKDLQDTIVRLAGEVRKQLAFALDVLEALHDMDEVKRFKEEVLDAIGRVAPEARAEIVQRLATRRTLRGAIELPA